jgi:hypothetical protein
MRVHSEIPTATVRRSVLVAACCALVLAAIAFLPWRAILAYSSKVQNSLDAQNPSVWVSPSPVSREKAVSSFGLSTLPQTASNVLFAWSSIGLGGRCRIFRFDAPPDECLTYAYRTASQSLGVDTQDAKKVFLRIPPASRFEGSLKHYGLGTAGSWFDVGSVTNGWCFEGGTPVMSLWVDTTVGRCYYHRSD